jgi:hypothetical protein
MLRGELERSRVADPLALVNSVMPMLSTDDYELAARYGIGRMLSEESRHLRQRAMRKPGTAPKSAKWHRRAQASEARPDIFAQRIVVAIDEHGADVSEFLGQCNRPMLREAARILRERSDAIRNSVHAQAGRYETLGRKLRGGALVNSLPKTTVEQILEA